MSDSRTLIRNVSDPEVADARAYGGKASGLSRMASAGVPIPPAFVIGTEGYHRFKASGKLDEAVVSDIDAALRSLEEATGKTFGGQAGTPLLVSVRSGAAISMPGMMDTILNLGLDARSAHQLSQGGGGAAFALDTWLRFWRMFGDIVIGADQHALMKSVESAIVRARDEPTAGAFGAVENAIVDSLRAYDDEVTADPSRQLIRTVEAVFRSWDSRRAKAYRKHHGISDDLGTAVTIQAMVFGNADAKSGSGVAFTRDPNDGTHTLYGEYLIGRQGEDLVAGTHTPVDLASPDGLATDLASSLTAYGSVLESLYKDAVDIEFTVETGKLYLLQVRAAKRTASAALKIAQDLVADEQISKSEAVRRISVDQIRKISGATFDDAALKAAKVLAKGLGSSPGHAVGHAVLDGDRAAERAASGEDVILLRPTTSPMDIRGMIASTGIVTARGGALSHAAVVSRALDKPCVVGCGSIDVDPSARTFAVEGQRYEEGEQISVDGATGAVYLGALELKRGSASLTSLRQLLDWADEMSGAEVWSPSYSSSELEQATGAKTPGLAVVGLTDLIIAGRQIDRFIAITESSSYEKPEGATELADLVRDACQPIFAQAAGIPFHVRLPRIGASRARRLIANWAELPPQLFLPVGAPSYMTPILRGLSDAAVAAGHDRVTALLAGAVHPSEFERFFAYVEPFAGLQAGVTLQNVAALSHAADFAAKATSVWIEVIEIIRVSYGFPPEISEAGGDLQRYIDQGQLASDPFKDPGELLTSLLRQAASAGGARAPVGIDLVAGASEDLTRLLHQAGFRRFAVAFARRDELRLSLAQEGR